MLTAIVVHVWLFPTMTVWKMLRTEHSFPSSALPIVCLKSVPHCLLFMLSIPCDQIILIVLWICKVPVPVALLSGLAPSSLEDIQLIKSATAALVVPFPLIITSVVPCVFFSSVLLFAYGSSQIVVISLCFTSDCPLCPHAFILSALRLSPFPLLSSLFSFSVPSSHFLSCLLFPLLWCDSSRMWRERKGDWRNLRQWKRILLLWMDSCFLSFQWSSILLPSIFLLSLTLWHLSFSLLSSHDASLSSLQCPLPLFLCSSPSRPPLAVLSGGIAPLSDQGEGNGENRNESTKTREKKKNSSKNLLIQPVDSEADAIVSNPAELDRATPDPDWISPTTLPPPPPSKLAGPVAKFLLAAESTAFNVLRTWSLRVVN